MVAYPTIGIPVPLDLTQKQINVNSLLVTIVKTPL